MWRLLADIDPRYRESAEESLVETAHLMAALVEQRSPSGTLDTAWLEPLFRDLYARRFEADIFGVKKESVELRATVVDARGIVLFDSLGRHEGKDFSQWRDVKLALAGQYGARTSVDLDGDSNTSVMVVAVPIRIDGRIVGAVSMAKPARQLRPVHRSGAAQDLDGRPDVGGGGAAAGGDRQRVAGAPVRHGERLPALRAQRAQPEPAAARPPRLQHAGRGLRRDARRAGGPPLRGRLRANVDPRTEEPAVGDPRRRRIAARTRHARGRPPALHRQRRPRNAAHPGAGRSHDGTHRAGAPPHARAHRAGGAARAVARPGRPARSRPARRAICACSCTKAATSASTATRCCCVARSAACWTTRSIFLPMAAPSRSRSRARAAASTSAFATTGRASRTSPTPRCSKSSSRSRAPTTSARARGSAWPSSRRSPSCTTGA